VDGVSPTIFGYLDPTSSIQTQLNGKQATLASPSTIVGLFSGCSGTQYLGADGACHASGGGAAPGTPDNSIQYRINGSTLGGMTNVLNDGLGNLNIFGVPDPMTPPTAALAGAGAGNVDNGVHCYAYSYVSATGADTFPTAAYGIFTTVTVVDNTMDGQVMVTAPPGGDPRITGTIFFRTLAGTDCAMVDPYSNFFQMTSLGTDGGTIIDNSSDASINFPYNTPYAFGDNYNATQGIKVGSGGSYLIIGADAGISLSNAFFPGAANSLIVTNLGTKLLNVPFPADATQFFNGTGAFSTPTPYLSGTTGSVSGGLTLGTCDTGTATVTGATTGMTAVASPVTDPGTGAIWNAWVSAPDTVTVKLCGLAILTPSATAFNVRVLP
jgi:hypothetical protein